MLEEEHSAGSNLTSSNRVQVCDLSSHQEAGLEHSIYVNIHM